MDDEWSVFVFIFQQLNVIYLMWQAYVLGSGKATAWVCQYFYPAGSCMSPVGMVSCVFGDVLLLSVRWILLLLVAIVIFCTYCRYFARSKTVYNDDEDSAETVVDPAVQEAFHALAVRLKGSSQYVIQDGSVGHTYEKIFVDYIDALLTDVTVEESYLRERHQVEQLKELLGVFARLAPNLKRVIIVANRVKKNDLLAIQTWLKGTYGILMKFRIDRALHDRWVRLNNGYDVSMGRGLDIYYAPRNVPWEQRKCKGCTFSFLPAKELESLRIIPLALYSKKR